MAPTQRRSRALMTQAYWISPEGHIADVPLTHIAMIIKHPGYFGLDGEAVRREFIAHNEPLGHEGWAREKIVCGLFDMGWVRVRYHPRSDSFTVQCRVESIPTEALVAGFAVYLIGRWPDTETATITLKDSDGSEVWCRDAEEVAAWAKEMGVAALQQAIVPT